MATDIERLVVSMEARTAQFEKAMNRAAGYTNQRMQQIDKRVLKTNSVLASLGRGIFAGIAGAGFTGAVATVQSITDQIARMGDEAKRAGLSTRAFQEFKYVAEQNRVSVDALVDGFKELNLRADEFIVTGAGPAAEALTRLGFSAEELQAKLSDPSALFTEIIGKLQTLDTAAQIRIADELFGGTGGEQFVQLISQGEEGIRRTIEEAHSLGIILDDEIIAKAAEVDRKFNQIANTVGTALRGAIVDATFALLDFITAQERAIAKNREVATVEDATNQINRQKALLDEWLAAADRIVPEIAGRIREVTTAYLENGKAAETAQAELQALAKQDMEAFPVTTSINGIIAVLELLIERTRGAKAELASLAADPIGAGATWEGLQNFAKPPTVRLGNSGSGGGGAGQNVFKTALADMQREVEMINAKNDAIRCLGTGPTPTAVSDGACTDGEGRLLRAETKISWSPLMPMAAVATGHSYACGMLLIHAMRSTITFQDQDAANDHLMATIPDLADQLHASHGPFSLAIATLTKAGARPCIYELHRGGHRPHLRDLRSTSFCISGPGFSIEEVNAAGGVRNGLGNGSGVALMELQRRQPTKPLDGAAEGFYIGAHVDHAVITPAGVTIERIHTWPDTIGEFITP